MTKRKNKAHKAPKSIDFKVNPINFINRDISWLEFNRRVLNEAGDDRTPLLERLRFLLIFSSNLDEFVMKRVGRLKRQVSSGLMYKSVDGLNAQDQFTKIRQHIQKDLEERQRIFMELVPKLKEHGIEFLEWEELNLTDQKFCEDYFREKIFPVLTPLSVDPGHPFPFISNLSFSLGMVLKNPQTDFVLFSRVKIPQVISPWIQIKKEKNLVFVNIISIIKNNLHLLYPGMEFLQVTPFRITRNADVEHRDDEAEDLMLVVEEGLKERRLAECVRLEMMPAADRQMLDFLKESLELNDDDIYILDYPLEYAAFKTIVDLDIPHLKYKPWIPVVPMEFIDENHLFSLIRHQDQLVHHPYESFTGTVEKFISHAADDPHVLTIKMTLYRTGDNSPFIKSLIRAAENGKQVVCLIELKARFDEQRNIFWAHKLEDAGVHVVYGVIGFKTHTKTALVIRQESDGEIVRYAHIGTGNYNSQTSNLYTDLGLLTANKKITDEVIEVFNYLTGSSLKTDYKSILVAPINMKSQFIQLIEAETEHHLKTGKGQIMAKMNSMEDEVMTEALYKASQAGVKITLIVRGFCCLKPGVKGLSENIQVISIIGRFLEHSRIFYFAQGQTDIEEGLFFIGSADWMHRNLHNRVELVVPVEHKKLKEKLMTFLNTVLADNRRSWLMHEDGTYSQQRPKDGEEERGTHEVMMHKTLIHNKDTP
jgi:polyphosphate kinase